MPLFIIFIFVVEVCVWTATAGVLETAGVGPAAIPYLGLIFIAAFSVLAGTALARLPFSSRR